MKGGYRYLVAWEVKSYVRPTWTECAVRMALIKAMAEEFLQTKLLLSFQLTRKTPGMHVC